MHMTTSAARGCRAFGLIIRWTSGSGGCVREPVSKRRHPENAADAEAQIGYSVSLGEQRFHGRSRSVPGDRREILERSSEVLLIGEITKAKDFLPCCGSG